LKSKIHRAKITQAELHYVGSITIDADLMDAANLIENEKVQVVNVNNGERLETYVIKGERGSGMVCLNGPAARKAQVGDVVIIIAYASMTPEEAQSYQPTIIFPDNQNKVVQSLTLLAIKQVKAVLKYTISLTVAGGLFWYVYKDLDITTSIAMLKGANYSWVFLSVFLAVISHFIRAYRWNLILEPVTNKPTLSRTFVAVMVGYLANLVVPRMGEVSRCGVLKKTDGIPMAVSIGTVVAERVIDLISLLIIIFVGFMIEFDRLNEFLSGFVYGKAQSLGENLFILYILAGFAFVGV